jgi:hypothetical protein
MRNLTKALTGQVAVNVPEIVFNFGYANHLELVKDYEMNLVFSNQVKDVEDLTDVDAKAYYADYPEGSGFRIEKAEVMSDYGRFCSAVIGAEVAILRKEKGTDLTDDDVIAENAELDIEASALLAHKATIADQCKSKGNGLATDLSHRLGYIRVLGIGEIKSKDDAGEEVITPSNIKIFVSKNPIDDVNHGECVLNINNACESDLDVIGQMRGITGFVKNISEKSFLRFVPDNGHLMVWETWFKKGKEKFAEHGDLIF